MPVCVTAFQPMVDILNIVNWVVALVLRELLDVNAMCGACRV